MTADEPLEHRWPRPPRDGYTVGDLFTLPELPSRTELIDAGLVFASPQCMFHACVVDLLVDGVRRDRPDTLDVIRNMTVVLDDRNGLAPDVSLVRTEAVTGPDQMSFRPQDVLLAVEVVSPDSESRDRTTKPQKYAAAGIPNFWRVERGGNGDEPVVHVYELGPLTKAYVHMGMQRGQLKVDKPCTLEIVLDRARRD
ncbi:Uma2 family endonuclease [Streptomyces sp. ASQP_92]|uniref:Uma2 family endonuclease n=1 Tax=Streptomyces sp. ASQP_92 TaxID=2979116 RepID=UPI0021C02D63|nr:Uma2 family endonuclease [Streptomyces sp. ASQP_92]MCT9091952.1 Uma2 family endonuclease [Streptomyces sp. ASQP_92]